MANVGCAVCGEPWDADGLRHGDVKPWQYDLFVAGAGCPCCFGVVAGQTRANEQGERVTVRGESDPLLDRFDRPLPQRGDSTWVLVKLSGVLDESCTREEVAQRYLVLIADPLEVDDAVVAQARDLVLDDADDDPDRFASVVSVLGLGLESKRPPWKRPADPVIWTCEGCGSAVRQNLDESPPKVERYEFRRGRYASGLYWKTKGDAARQAEIHHSIDWEEVLVETIDSGLKAPSDRLMDGKPYCLACADTCANCRELTGKDELECPEGEYLAHKAMCPGCIEEIPTCSTCCRQLDESDATNHEGECEYCAYMCERCKENCEGKVMLDAKGNCPKCWENARARRKGASHKRRKRRGY